MSSKANKVLWIALGGLVAVPAFISAAIDPGSGTPAQATGGLPEREEAPSAPAEASLSQPQSPEVRASPRTIAEASDEEKRFITQNTPDMKQAADAVGLLINMSGHLCAEVFYVEPTDGGQFLVDCIKHEGRDIKVRYVVDGATGSAREL